MAKGVNQKLKLLYIIKILEEQSDENHPVSTQALIEELAKYNISAERKSIYDDINQLVDFGYDIITNSSRKNGGYYLAERHFEISELKLLVDSVQASRFITVAKSRELIKKLEHFTSQYDQIQLRRDVYVQNRIKTDNESIYYVINDIYLAMQQNKKISFIYLGWTIDKVKLPKHNGARYVISPFALTIKDENYYLIAYDENSKIIKHYRVDKIKDVLILDEARTGNELFDKFDVATYTDRSFGMFSGEEENVTLVFKKEYAGVLIDRFGLDISIRSLDDAIASARVSVNVSNQFYAWIASLDGNVSIQGPANVLENYKAYLKKLCDNLVF